MSKYPKVKFGDFVEHVLREIELEADKDYPSVGVKWYGEGVHVHEVKSGGSFNAARFEIKENDIIYNDMWARNGSVAIVPPHLDGAVASSHFPTFLPDTSRVLPKYLQYYFKTPVFWDDCENASRGSTGRNQIKKSTFYAIEIPLPSLDEQNRIIERIEALASRITKAQFLRENADLEADKLLDSCLTHFFESNNAPKKSLREVSHFQRGRFSWRPRNEPRFYGGKYPFIQIGDIPRDKKLITSHTQTLNDDGLKISRIFPAGTIVLSIAATIGAVGILDFDSCMPDSLVGLNVKPETAISDYLFYFLKYSQSHFEDIAPQTAQKNINIGILEDVRLPVPPLDEQRRIVAYLDSVQARLASLRELQSATGEELSALLPSVLDRAFRESCEDPKGLSR